jgi:hypothetical protein
MIYKNRDPLHNLVNPPLLFLLRQLVIWYAAEQLFCMNSTITRDPDKMSRVGEESPFVPSLLVLSVYRNK